MHSLANNNLTRLLKALSDDELKRFEKFLDSPYHNTIANVRKLFRELRKHAPEFSGESFSRENIWKCTFPGKEFNYGVLKNLLHELTVLCQKFLVAESVEVNKDLKEKLLIEQLIVRNAGNLSAKKQREFWKKFNSGIRPESNQSLQEYYFYASEIFWKKTFFNKTNHLKIPGESEYFLGTTYSTIAFFILICNEYNNAVADSSASSIMLEKQTPVMIARALNSGFMDEILKELRIHSVKDYRILDTYVALNKAQIHAGDSELFYEFRSRLIENATLFSKSDLKDLYNNLSSLLTFLNGYEVNIGDEMLNNFDLMSRFGILTDHNGRLGSMYYYYYLVCAFRNLKFKRVEEIADKYLSVTEGDAAGNPEKFTSALIAFGKCEYDQALSRISQMKQPARFIDFFIREFRACCFYELDAEEYFEREYTSLHSLRKDYELQFPKLTNELKFHFKAVRDLFKLRKQFDVVLQKEMSASLKKSRVWITTKLLEVQRESV